MQVRKQLAAAQATAAEANLKLAGMDSRLAGALTERDALAERAVQNQEVVDMAGATVTTFESNLREQKSALVQRERECHSLTARVATLETANQDLLAALGNGAAEAESVRAAADHARNALIRERDSARSQVAAPFLSYERGTSAENSRLGCDHL
jgi:hypothetical protein